MVGAAVAGDVLGLDLGDQQHRVRVAVVDADDLEGRRRPGRVSQGRAHSSHRSRRPPGCGSRTPGRTVRRRRRERRPGRRPRTPRGPARPPGPSRRPPAPRRRSPSPASPTRTPPSTSTRRSPSGSRAERPGPIWTPPGVDVSGCQNRRRDRCTHQRTEDPGRPAARRRAVRGRTLQDPARAPRRARGHRLVPDGYVAPAGAGPQRRRPGARGAGRAVLDARGLRGGPGQRRRDGVLGRRDVRADRAEEPAPDLRRVLQQVHQRREGGAVARRAVGDRQRARLATGGGGRGRCRRLRLGAQRDLHRRDGAGGPARGHRRRRARAHRRHVGRRRPAGRPDRVRRLLLRTAEVVRLRRRPVRRDLLPRRHRARRADRRVGTGTSRRSSTSRSRSTSPGSTRPTTPPRSRRCSSWPSSWTG